MSDTIRTEEVQSLLSEIIAIDSVNHNFRENRAGEADLCDWVESYLQNQRIAYQSQSVRNRQRNVVARVEGADPSRVVCFEAHLDTTTARGMSVHPFGAELANGSVYGRGACDCKSALAAMLVALKHLREAATPPPRTVVVAATVDREVGMTGIQRLLTGFRPAAAVVGAPTNLGVARCCNGCVRWRFAVGESPQSYVPNERNAIRDAVRLITALEARLAPAIASRPHPLLGEARLRPSRMRANGLEGFLPAHCAVEYECYCVPGFEASVILDEINDVVSTLVADEPSLKIAVEAPTLNDGPVELPESSALVQAACSAGRAVLGAVDIVGYPDNGHANRFHAVGIPSIAFGPGHPSLARSAGERIPVAQLAPAAEVYLRIMRTALEMA